MQPNPDNPEPPPPGDQAVVLWCNCLQLCDGVWTEIKERRTWNRHAKYREGPAEFFQRRRGDDPTQSGSRAAPARAPANRAQAPAAAHAVQAAAAAHAVHAPAVATAVLRQGSSGQAATGASRAQELPEPMAVDPPPMPPAIPAPVLPAVRVVERMRYDDDPPDPPPDEADAPVAEPIYGYTEDVGVPQQARRREVAQAQDFIRALQTATLGTSGLSAETVARLRTPAHAVAHITDEERAAIRMFLARGNASEDNYTDNRAALVELHQEHEKTFPTYEQVRHIVSHVTGIDALVSDMCINSCVAFTGPFAELDKCPICRESRYDAHEATHGRHVARRTFHTYPLGPQLQAMYASPENANLMHHRAERTRDIQDQLRANPNAMRELDDVYWGSDYRAAVTNAPITDDDTVLMFSIDGAQLYQSKASDCWFYIWILLDLPPQARYKKRYVLPGGVIGGPKKPKNVDSFLFPGLHHLSALQRDGLKIWDAAREAEITSKPFLYLATADGPGMAYLSGLVGHQGARGCRLYCGLVGRFKPSASTYYPAMLRAEDNPHGTSNHPDYDPTPDAEPSATTSARYQENLREVEGSRNLGQYQRRRLRTGIAKPSIFSGLPRVLALPGCFGADLMHLITLNLTDLLISLFRGTIHCDATDDRSTWDWAVLADADVWRAHGKLVQDCTRYLPGSFDRPPRNPAEKISSGYKAWEFLLYVYGLLPGLLYYTLAATYYLNFCKLVYGIRIMLQHVIPASQIREAHHALVDFAEEFEKLYYCRRLDRLHIIRHSIHALIHICHEALRVGPGSLYSQWTLENFIGNITREIKQHATPYANVSERALRRCRMNALQAMIPAFASDESPPATSIDLGAGFRLLRARDRSMYSLTVPTELAALHRFLAANNVQLHPTYTPSVQRWARLRLPNGQIARTAWKEEITESRGREIRRARMVKLTNNRFAEVLYFFLYNMPAVGQRAFAMISYFSPPDPEILAASYNVLAVCLYQGNLSRAVIEVQAIEAVVAMVPFPETEEQRGRGATRFFVVEKPGLAVAELGGFAEPDVPVDGVENADEDD